MGSESETREIPSTLQACSFFSTPYLEICSALFHFLFPHVCICWHFQNSSALLWNPRYFKKVIYQSLSQLFGKLFVSGHAAYASFTRIWTYKTHDLPYNQYIDGSFVLGNASIEKTDKSTMSMTLPTANLFQGILLPAEAACRVGCAAWANALACFHDAARFLT